MKRLTLHHLGFQIKSTCFLERGFQWKTKHMFIKKQLSFQYRVSLTTCDIWETTSNGLRTSPVLQRICKLLLVVLRSMVKQNLLKTLY